MANQQPLKSILKKSSDHPSSSSSKSTTFKTPARSDTVSPPSFPNRPPASSSWPTDSEITTDSISRPRTPTTARRKLPAPEEARRIAVHHATLLQHRKALELKILHSVEELLDFPNPPSPGEAPHPAYNPLPSDVVTFKRNLIHFQPSDYDDLIEERNIINKCGYALCANERKRQPTKAKFRVLHGARRIVEAKELERFCCDDCARRALWIKVQLNTEPAWMRVGADGLVGRGGMEYKITLLEEPHDDMEQTREGSEDMNKLAEQLEGLGISSKSLLLRSANTAPKNNQVVSPVEGVQINELVQIVERLPPAKTPTFPSIGISDEHAVDAGAAAAAVEGYIVRGDHKGLAAKWKRSAENASKWVKSGKDGDDGEERKTRVSLQEQEGLE